MLAKKIYYKELSTNATKVIIILILILPLQEFMARVGTTAAGSMPITTLLTITLFGTISSFPEILTIACILAIVITLNRYSKENEFIVWMASGVSPFYFLRQTFYFIIPFAVICGLCTTVINPWANVKTKTYSDFILKQEANALISSGVFRENEENNQIYFIDKYDLKKGILEKVFVKNISQSGIMSTITGLNGKISNDNGVFTITLLNGNYNQVFNMNQSKYSFHFDKLIAKNKQLYKSELKNEELEGLTFVDLLKRNSVYATSEINWRTTNALLVIILGLLLVPLSIQIGRVQGSLVFIFPAIFFVIYQNLIFTVNGLINQGVAGLSLMFGIHFLVISIGLLLTYLKTYPKGYLMSKNKK